MSNEKTAVIIAAAGKGTRMNHSLPKQYLPLEGKPILAHTLINLSNIPEVDSITLVVSQDRVQWCKEALVDKFNIKKVEAIIEGGETRGESVLKGLNSLDKETTIVAIHDGVRPFITALLFNNIIKQTKEFGAAICAIPVRDTLKNVDKKMKIKSTHDRNGLWLVQTPQAFHYSLILEAYKKAKAESFQATDDAGIVERLPHPVKIVEGSPLNIKITTPEDLVLAEAIYEIIYS
jgi:2-C-methyl-D-erythritol 4-phosphate cytidylyltransferase